MKKDLIKKIEEFNKIKYPQDDSRRIIVATLHSDCDKSLINNTVTG